MKCIGCDTAIPPGTNKCPMCGAVVPNQDNQSNPPKIFQPLGPVNTKIDQIQKKCKHCSMQIPKTAKICPFCRERLTTSLVTKIIIGIFLLMLVSAMFAKPMPPPDSNADKNIVPETKKVEVLTGKALNIKSKHPSWGNEECKAIAENKIFIGMSTDQVKEAWGKPYKINISTGRYGTHEQWVMHGGGSTYVYFDNGIMTSLQQSK